jgi:acyl-CoA thioesterase FadM
MAPTSALGPPSLGLRLGDDLAVTDDGWVSRSLTVPEGLDGPDGILQGGFSAGVAIAAAQGIDRFGAPVTSVHASLRAPTPLDATLEIRARATDVTARYQVQTWDGDTLLVESEVELAGHDTAPQAFDLAELGTLPLPSPRAQDSFPHCFVCGHEPRHPDGLHLVPAWLGDDAIANRWVCDDTLGDERSMIDPLLVSAVLDCPTVWAAWQAIERRGDVGALLARYHLRFFRDAPVMEELRTVARLDDMDGRKVHARGALVDEGGGIYAVSSALHICVPELPRLSTSGRG